MTCATSGATPSTRVEDRIRQVKATGLRNFPCRAWTEDNAWLQVVLTATDLIARTQLIAFGHVPQLARCEVAAFRYRVLHVAARLTTSRSRPPDQDHWRTTHPTRQSGPHRAQGAARTHQALTDTARAPSKPNHVAA